MPSKKRRKGLCSAKDVRDPLSPRGMSNATFRGTPRRPPPLSPFYASPSLASKHIVRLWMLFFFVCCSLPHRSGIGTPQRVSAEPSSFQTRSTTPAPLLAHWDAQRPAAQLQISTTPRAPSAPAPQAPQPATRRALGEPPPPPSESQTATFGLDANTQPRDATDGRGTSTTQDGEEQLTPPLLRWPAGLKPDATPHSRPSQTTIGHPESETSTPPTSRAVDSTEQAQAAQHVPDNTSSPQNIRAPQELEHAISESVGETVQPEKKEHGTDHLQAEPLESATGFIRPNSDGAIASNASHPRGHQQQQDLPSQTTRRPSKGASGLVESDRIQSSPIGGRLENDLTDSSKPRNTTLTKTSSRGPPRKPQESARQDTASTTSRAQHSPMLAAFTHTSTTETLHFDLPGPLVAKTLETSRSERCKIPVTIPIYSNKHPKLSHFSDIELLNALVLAGIEDGLAEVGRYAPSAVRPEWVFIAANATSDEVNIATRNILSDPCAAPAILLLNPMAPATKTIEYAYRTYGLPLLTMLPLLDERARRDLSNLVSFAPLYVTQAHVLADFVRMLQWKRVALLASLTEVSVALANRFVDLMEKQGVHVYVMPAVSTVHTKNPQKYVNDLAKEFGEANVIHDVTVFVVLVDRESLPIVSRALKLTDLQKKQGIAFLSTMELNDYLQMAATALYGSRFDSAEWIRSDAWLKRSNEYNLFSGDGNPLFADGWIFVSLGYTKQWYNVERWMRRRLPFIERVQNGTHTKVAVGQRAYGVYELSLYDIVRSLVRTLVAEGSLDKSKAVADLKGAVCPSSRRAGSVMLPKWNDKVAPSELLFKAESNGTRQTTSATTDIHTKLEEHQQQEDVNEADSHQGLQNSYLVSGTPSPGNALQKFMDLKFCYITFMQAHYPNVSRSSSATLDQQWNADRRNGQLGRRNFMQYFLPEEMSDNIWKLADHHAELRGLCDLLSVKSRLHFLPYLLFNTRRVYNVAGTSISPVPIGIWEFSGKVLSPEFPRVSTDNAIERPFETYLQSVNHTLRFRPPVEPSIHILADGLEQDKIGKMLTRRGASAELKTNQKAHVRFAGSHLRVPKDCVNCGAVELTPHNNDTRCPICEEDRGALMSIFRNLSNQNSALFGGLGGVSLSADTNQTLSVCEVWPRVVHCTSSTSYILQLAGLELQGILPGYFGLLKHAEEINLARNSFTGKPPKLSPYLCPNPALPLNLHHRLGGYPEAPTDRPSKLKRLDLSGNRILGEIPDHWGFCSSLTSLLLGDNFLYGRMKETLCLLDNLERLDVSFNHLTGRLPWCIGGVAPNDGRSSSSSGRRRSYVMYRQATRGGDTVLVKRVPKGMRYLRVLHVEGNRFEGALPASLKWMPLLTTAIFRGNMFSGRIPDGWPSPTAHVVRIDLSANPRLTLPVPPTLLKAFLETPLNIDLDSHLFNCSGGSRMPPKLELYGDEFKRRLARTSVERIMHEGLGFLCAECPSGSAVTSDARACIPCPAGTVAMDPGSLTCMKCARGTFSASSATECHLCPPGYFNYADGSAGCHPCPPHHYTEEPGSEHCYPCPAGAYCDSVHQQRAPEAKPGWYRINLRNITMDKWKGRVGIPIAGAVGTFFSVPPRPSPIPPPTAAGYVSRATARELGTPSFYGAQEEKLTHQPPDLTYHHVLVDGRTVSMRAYRSEPILLEDANSHVRFVAIEDPEVGPLFASPQTHNAPNWGSDSGARPLFSSREQKEASYEGDLSKAYEKERELVSSDDSDFDVAEEPERSFSPSPAATPKTSLQANNQAFTKGPSSASSQLEQHRQQRSRLAKEEKRSEATFDPSFRIYECPRPSHCLGNNTCASHSAGPYCHQCERGYVTPPWRSACVPCQPLSVILLSFTVYIIIGASGILFIFRSFRKMAQERIDTTTTEGLVPSRPLPLLTPPTNSAVPSHIPFEPVPGGIKGAPDKNDTGFSDPTGPVQQKSYKRSPSQKPPLLPSSFYDDTDTGRTRFQKNQSVLLKIFTNWLELTGQALVIAFQSALVSNGQRASDLSSSLEGVYNFIQNLDDPFFVFFPLDCVLPSWAPAPVHSGLLIAFIFPIFLFLSILAWKFWIRPQEMLSSAAPGAVLEKRDTKAGIPPECRGRRPRVRFLAPCCSRWPSGTTHLVDKEQITTGAMVTPPYTVVAKRSLVATYRGFSSTTAAASVDCCCCDRCDAKQEYPVSSAPSQSSIGTNQLSTGNSVMSSHCCFLSTSVRSPPVIRDHRKRWWLRWCSWIYYPEFLRRGAAHRSKASNVPLAVPDAGTLETNSLPAGASFPKRVDTWSESVGVFTVVYFLLYPSLTRQFLKNLECKEMDTSRLGRDFRIVCTAAPHTAYLYLAWIGLFSWTFGVPLFFGYMMRRNRHNLLDPKVVIRWGFLLDGYERRYYWWEVWAMTRKVLLDIPGVVPFFDDNLKFVSMIALAIVSLVAHVAAEPFDNRCFKVADRMESFVLWTFLLTVLTVPIHQSLNGKNAGWMSRTLSKIILGITVVGSCLFILWALLFYLRSFVDHFILQHLCFFKQRPFCGGSNTPPSPNIQKNTPHFKSLSSETDGSFAAPPAEAPPLKQQLHLPTFAKPPRAALPLQSQEADADACLSSLGGASTQQSLSCRTASSLCATAAGQLKQGWLSPSAGQLPQAGISPIQSPASPDIPHTVTASSKTDSPFSPFYVSQPKIRLDQKLQEFIGLALRTCVNWTLNNVLFSTSGRKVLHLPSGPVRLTPQGLLDVSALHYAEKRFIFEVVFNDLLDIQFYEKPSAFDPHFVSKNIQRIFRHYAFRIHIRATRRHLERLERISAEGSNGIQRTHRLLSETFFRRVHWHQQLSFRNSFKPLVSSAVRVVRKATSITRWHSHSDGLHPFAEEDEDDDEADNNDHHHINQHHHSLSPESPNNSIIEHNSTSMSRGPGSATDHLASPQLSRRRLRFYSDSDCCHSGSSMPVDQQKRKERIVDTAKRVVDVSYFRGPEWGEGSRCDTSANRTMTSISDIPDEAFLNSCPRWSPSTASGVSQFACVLRSISNSDPKAENIIPLFCSRHDVHGDGDDSNYNQTLLLRNRHFLPRRLTTTTTAATFPPDALGASPPPLTVPWSGGAFTSASPQDDGDCSTFCNRESCQDDTDEDGSLTHYGPAPALHQTTSKHVFFSDVGTGAVKAGPVSALSDSPRKEKPLYPPCAIFCAQRISALRPSSTLLQEQHQQKMRRRWHQAGYYVWWATVFLRALRNFPKDMANESTNIHLSIEEIQDSIARLEIATYKRVAKSKEEERSKTFISKAYRVVSEAKVRRRRRHTITTTSMTPMESSNNDRGDRISRTTCTRPLPLDEMTAQCYFNASPRHRSGWMFRYPEANPTTDPKNPQSFHHTQQHNNQPMSKPSSQQVAAPVKDGKDQGKYP